MRLTNNWNVPKIIRPLILLFVLHVPILVQSYDLISAKIDNVEPYVYTNEFYSDEYTEIRLEFINGRSRIVVTNAGVTGNYPFPCADFYCKILNYVAIDTGTPNRLVDFRFVNENEIPLYYRSIKPDRAAEQVSYPVNFMRKYDCVLLNCFDGNCGDKNCHGNVSTISEDARIHVEKVTGEDENGYALKRFIVRDINEDRTMPMVFTSRSFNITSVRTKAHIMMSVQIRNALFKILIQFKKIRDANAFHAYVTNNRDINTNIPLYEPNVWEEYLLPPDNEVDEDTKED